MGILGLKAVAGASTVSVFRDGVWQKILISWNCIGWQSLLFFAITAFIGFQGDRYTGFSKLKALVIGALGTFLINIFRIVVVVLVAYFFGQAPAIIIHDYGSILGVIAWLFGFWWFSYNFVLETKHTNVNE